MAGGTRSRRRTALRGGIDVGGTNILAAIVSPAGEVVAEAKRPTPASGGPADVVEAIVAATAEAAERAAVETDSLGGVGVGFPAPVDVGTGSVSVAVNLPNWSGPFGLADALAAELGTEVRVGNDVDLATHAEFRLGAGRAYRSLLGIFWGTGVGGGVILDGRRWVGRGGAGEIGHMVVRKGGRRCPCGRRGCMEAYAGRGPMEARARRLHERGRETRLFEIMEKRGRARLTAGVWGRALEVGDELARELVDEAVEAIAVAAASAVNLIDFEAVVIGGGLGVRLGEPYVERIRKRMRKSLFDEEHPPAILLAELGDVGGAIGGSLLFEE
jgi:glucokinase